MSNIVSASVQKRKVGSPTRKAILMFMASCASDDGSGVWTSKATMARDLEMAKRTVQNSVEDLVSLGLISETGTRRCANGFTIEYRLNLNAIARLEPTNPKAPQKHRTALQQPKTTNSSTGAGDAPVQNVHPTSVGRAPQDVQDVHPNPTGTIQEPPTRTDAPKEEGFDFELIWSAYPSDKHRGKATCHDHFKRAVSEGAEPHHILAAVRAYATETLGFSRSKVCFTDNWFRDARWENHAAKRCVSNSSTDRAAFWADRINAGKRIYGDVIDPPLLAEMIRRELTTVDLIKAAGVTA